jgi:flagellar biosynthetic protein FlhB
MSENSTPEERTELPSDRRMQKVRSEGTVHMSMEVTQVASLIFSFVLLSYMIGAMWRDMRMTMKYTYLKIADREYFFNGSLKEDLIYLTKLWAPDLGLWILAVAAVGMLGTFLQTDFNVREKWIKFRFDMLNPITGIKRIVSINGMVTTLKALFKLAIIMPIGYFALKAAMPEMISLVHMSVQQIMAFMGAKITDVFWAIMKVLTVFAVFDYFWSRYQWFKQNKMTKNEVKDERKSVEGDEETKRRIQMKGLQRIVQRIKQTVPKADVIITNPTHFAVALKYDRETMSAPTVVAKGADHMALRIREIAKESGVPILERKTLARALYSSVEVGNVIPRELFKAVAEVLAYIFKLKNPAVNNQVAGR